jgi:hypothetical protein
MQLDIFIHSVENNSESQAHLNENRAHFTDQCKKVLALLESGVRLTTVSAVDYHILSLPRRILDLKQNGVKIEEEWLTGLGKRKIKVWFKK